MKNNKLVLLVHPEISRTKYNFAGIIDNEPLELEYIWSMLADFISGKCEVKIFNRLSVHLKQSAL